MTKITNFNSLQIENKLEGKKQFYKGLDWIALRLIKGFYLSREITYKILCIIWLIYHFAKPERYFTNSYFESAYHAAITNDVEFFFSRLLYHFLRIKHCENFTIYLRRQIRGAVPDIRIEFNKQTVAILELKIKGGWTQVLYSPQTYQKEKRKFNNKEIEENPDKTIAKEKEKISKYSNIFKLDKKYIFVLLPTLALIHRMNHSTGINEYRKHISDVFGIPEKNFILLSRNKRLDLANSNLVDKEFFEPTDDFEDFLFKLNAITNGCT